jgi:hypothetical protein
MMIKRALLVLLCLTAFPALAQPVESEPLGPAPYNLQNETDPMALGAPDLGAQAPVQEPVEIAPILSAPPSAPVTDNAPEPATAPTPNYPNNPVSGLPLRDDSAFEGKIFCTVKATFGKLRGQTDEKTASTMKSYLDENATKLSYIRSETANGFSYCVTVANHADRAEVYRALRQLMPAPNARNAPVTLSGSGFATIKSHKEVRD